MEQPFIREFLQRGSADIQRGLRLFAEAKCMGQVDPVCSVVRIVMNGSFLLADAFRRFSGTAAQQYALPACALEHLGIGVTGHFHGFVVAGSGLLEAVIHHVLMDHAIAAPVVRGGGGGAEEFFELLRCGEEVFRFVTALVNRQQPQSVVVITGRGGLEQVIHQHVVELGDVRQQQHIRERGAGLPAADGLCADAQLFSGLLLGEGFVQAELA